MGGKRVKGAAKVGTKPKRVKAGKAKVKKKPPMMKAAKVKKTAKRGRRVGSSAAAAAAAAAAAESSAAAAAAAAAAAQSSAAAAAAAAAASGGKRRRAAGGGEVKGKRRRPTYLDYGVDNMDYMGDEDMLDVMKMEMQNDAGYMYHLQEQDRVAKQEGQQTFKMGKYRGRTFTDVFHSSDGKGCTYMVLNKWSTWEARNDDWKAYRSYAAAMVDNGAQYGGAAGRAAVEGVWASMGLGMCCDGY